MNGDAAGDSHFYTVPLRSWAVVEGVAGSSHCAVLKVVAFAALHSLGDLNLDQSTHSNCAWQGGSVS